MKHISTLVAFISACLFGSFAHGAESLAPYTAFSWSPVDRTSPHTQQMYALRLEIPPRVAARTFAGLKPGRRVALICNASADPFNADPVQCNDRSVIQSPWLDNSRKKAAGQWAMWEQQYAAVGGPAIDFVAIDCEYTWSTWTLGAPPVAAIQADPRYAALAKRFHIQAVNPGGYSPQWDDAMTSLRNDALREIFGELSPLFGNYSDSLVAADQAKQYLDLNGWPMLSTTLAGTAQCPECYGCVGQIKNNRDDGSHPDFEHDPLASVIWMADRMRINAMSPQPVLPWVAWKSATHIDPPPVYFGNSPYWDEMLWHLLMSAGSTNVLAWNVHAKPSDNAAYDTDLAAFAGQTQNAPTIQPLSHDPVPMNARLLVSGVQAGSRRVYRVTTADVKPIDQSIQTLLPGDARMSTVVIPAGQCGVWVSETAK